MFPFFNPGAVNSNGNQPSAAMQQAMMNPGNFPLNPMQFQQQTMNPQMGMPFNFSAFPFQQAPMNFNQIPQNPAQLLNQNLLMGLGFPNQMQGVNPFFQMPIPMQNFNGQVLPGNLNLPQNLPFDAKTLMGFGYIGGRPQLPMNSNVPNQMLNMNSNVPNQMLNTSQQGIGVQAFAPLPIQNSLQNGHCAAGQSQGNNTNPPQGLNNQLGVSRQNNSFVRNTNQQGSQSRFSNQQGKRNPNFQKFQPKGGNNDERKSSFAKSVKTPQPEKRSIPLNYTEQEIKHWREARQKNYPTKANIEKLKEKQKDPEISKKEAELRCQQLKEILAKQAELGCEVAEIPSSYLLDAGAVPGKKDNGRTFNENDRRVRFKQNNENFHNNRRPWKQNDRGPYGHNPSYNNHRQNNQFAKRPRLMNGDSVSHDAGNKREPTLLRRLLETDIRRDKRNLLQVFRAMVMNSFFEDWPEKPLKFPQVLVREIGNEEGILGETEETVDNDGDLNKKMENSESHANVVASDDEEKEEGGNQEEGEITD